MKGRIFFLDLLVVFVISIILIVSAVVLVKNWSYFMVENTFGRMTDSLALDISENLINSPGCTDKNCTKLWDGEGEVAIPGLAAVSENGVIRNYVLDRKKVEQIEGMNFTNFVSDEFAGRDVKYYISVREMGGQNWSSGDLNAEPKIRTSVVRRLVMIQDGQELRNGILEVRVIV